MPIRYGSVCSGVEAATLAWQPLGWQPVFFSEIEPFPCAVLHARYDATRPINALDPEAAATEKEKKLYRAWNKQNATLPENGTIPNEGDFTKIGKKYHGKFDLLVGGTPCQDLSVAGKRAGFGGKRSSLALDFIRLAYESGCKWIVWENVPGVFSSRGGGDFAAFLSLLSGSAVEIPDGGFATAGFVCNARRDRYGLAWRVLDAQFTRVSGFSFAVPQRRRRVFVVGYFGDWTRAAEVLLEPDRLQWNTPARIKAREIASGNAGNRLEPASREYRSGHQWEFVSTDTAGTLKTNCGSIGGSSMNLHVAGFSGGQGSKAGGIGYSEETAPTIKASQSGSNQAPDIVLSLAAAQGGELGSIGENVSQTLTRNNGGFSYIAEMKSKEAEKGVICRATQQGNSECCKELAPTLTAAAGKSGNNQPIVLCFSANDNGRDLCRNISPTIRKGGTTTADGGAIVPAIVFVQQNQLGEIRTGEIAGTVSTNGNASGRNCPLVCIAKTPTICAKEPISQYGKIAGTLEARHDSSPCADRGQNIVFDGYLTPGESQSIRIYGKNGAFPTIKANENGGQNRQSVFCYENHGQDSRISELKKGVAPQLNAKAGTGGNNLPLVQECYPINSMIIGKDAKDGDRQTTGIGNNGDPSPTIGTSHHHAVAIAENIIGRKVENGGNGVGAQEEITYTQNCSGVMGVCTDEPSETTVRRLTPLECERLMGFPDNYTRISWNGKPETSCPDAPRYKACGNSMCVNVMRWIGIQIQRIEEENHK